MKRARSLIALLALTPLAGCMAGPNYHRPAVPTPPAFRDLSDNPQLQAQATSYADLPWWQVFKDPKLQELIRRCAQTKLRFAASHRTHRSRARRVSHHPLQPISSSGRQRHLHRRTGKHSAKQIQLSHLNRRCSLPARSLRTSSSRHRGLTSPTARHGRREANRCLDPGK